MTEVQWLGVLLGQYLVAAVLLLKSAVALSFWYKCSAWYYYTEWFVCHETRPLMTKLGLP